MEKFRLERFIKKLLIINPKLTEKEARKIIIKLYNFWERLFYEL